MDFKHLQRQKTYFMVIISTVNTEHTYDLIIHIFPFQNWTFIIVVYGMYYPGAVSGFKWGGGARFFWNKKCDN